jgi:hypothetical protein
VRVVSCVVCVVCRVVRVVSCVELQIAAREKQMVLNKEKLMQSKLAEETSLADQRAALDEEMRRAEQAVPRPEEDLPPPAHLQREIQKMEARIRSQTVPPRALPCVSCACVVCRVRVRVVSCRVSCHARLTVAWVGRTRTTGRPTESGGDHARVQGGQEGVRRGHVQGAAAEQPARAPRERPQGTETRLPFSFSFSFVYG